MSRSDPIRTNYFGAVQTAERISDGLFYFNVALSIATLLIDQKKYAETYDLVLLFFCLCVVAMFTLGLLLKLHLTPRAEDKRRQDFFSSACTVNLTHQQTEGYYNNDFKEPIKRMAAQVLENSLFSKTIALKMARWERIKVVGYALIWSLLVHYRKTELGWIVVASQVLFSEQILSKWIRLEWLRIRCDRTFDDVYKLFLNQPSDVQFKAHALDAVTMYETSKASSGVTLSSKIFDRLNTELSAEWEKVKATLRI